VIKVTISIKHTKIQLLPMFSVDDEVNYQSMRDTLAENISIINHIILKAVKNGS
jgi:hypothetical protein